MQRSLPDPVRSEHAGAAERIQCFHPPTFSNII